VEKKVPIPGNTRRALPGAKVVGRADPNQRIDITVQLRWKQGENLDKKIEDLAENKLAQPEYMTRAELAEVAGADPANIPKIDAFAHEHGLSVTEVSLPGRTVKLSGTMKAFGDALGVKLQRYKAGALSYRGCVGTLSVPAGLSG